MISLFGGCLECEDVLQGALLCKYLLSTKVRGNVEYFRCLSKLADGIVALV